MKKLILSFFFIISIVGYLHGAAFISVQVKGIADVDFLLGHHYGNKNKIVDTLHLDKKGKVSYSKMLPLKQGVYFLMFKNKDYIEFLISEEQIVSISLDITDINSSIEVTGNEDSRVFNEYQKANYFLYERSKVLQEKLKRESDISRIEYLKQEIKEIDNEMKVLKKKYISEYPNTFTAKIIKASLNPDPPSFNRSLDYNDPGSMKQVVSKYYQYHIYHYFDNIDFSDERLLYTPIYHAKIERFISKMLRQKPDIIIPEIKKLLVKAQANDEIYKYTLNFLLEYYLKKNKRDYDEVVVFIGENYFINNTPDWVDSKFLATITKRVNKIKSTMVGAKAIDLHLKTIDGKQVSLYDIKSKYLVLYFWDVNCGFCKTITPELYKLKNDFEFLKVMAVYTGLDVETWKNEIEKNNYNWINVYDPEAKSGFAEKYNVFTLPMIYLLSEDKEILSIDVSIVHLRNFLTLMNKQ